jgi:hypothetical protein
MLYFLNVSYDMDSIFRRSIMKPHNWMMVNWKPMYALIYSIVCLADFVVFPAWVGIHRVNYFELLEAVSKFDPKVQAELIHVAMKSWEPFTLKGTGLFHLASGALLTGAAITKGPDSNAVFTDKGLKFARRKEDRVKVSVE